MYMIVLRLLPLCWFLTDHCPGAGVPVTSPQLYSAGCTEDLRVSLMYLKYTYPNAPLLGVGFSLGANVLTRYLGEEGEQSRLISGCAIACVRLVFFLFVSKCSLLTVIVLALEHRKEFGNVRISLTLSLINHTDQLLTSMYHSVESSWISRSVYSKALGRNLMNMMKRNVVALSQFRDHPVSQAITDAIALDAPPCMSGFDNMITRIIGGSAPCFPFPSVFEYYEWCASDRVISDIRVPYLAINSKDDPIVIEYPTDSAGNGWVALAFTTWGGHLGWFEADTNHQMRRWVRKPVLEWIKGLIERLSLDEHGIIHGRKCRPFRKVDGFLKEVGREEYGCREIDGDVQIVDFKSGGHLRGL
jgi:uncharacterized protein